MRLRSQAARRSRRMNSSSGRQGVVRTAGAFGRLAVETSAALETPVRFRTADQGFPLVELPASAPGRRLFWRGQ